MGHAWEQRKLDEIIDYQNGIAHENGVKEKGTFELVTLKSVDADGLLQSSGKFVDSKIGVLPENSLIMILSEQMPGGVGMSAVIPENNAYVLNQRVAQLTIKNDYNPTFLSNTINQNQHYFELQSGGTKVQNVSKGSVLKFQAFYPHVEEQVRIAKCLHFLNNTIAHHQRKQNTS